jgi:diaminopimelate decarboxylase
MPGIERVDVVGPICESGDFLAQDRMLPPMERGQLLAIFTAGAYGMSMASHYNAMPLPAEVLIDGAEATTIRAREEYEDLIRRERHPEPLLLPTAERVS